MQNIKTGIVVALLLAVCYGAFKALNEPEPELPPELNEWVTNETNVEDLLDVDMGHTGDFGKSDSSIPSISLPSDMPSANDSLTGASLPSSSLGTLAKNDPVKPNSLTLGATSGASSASGSSSARTDAIDGPAVQLPTDLSGSVPTAESDSLVPDSFPSSPLNTTSNSLPAANTNASATPGASTSSSPDSSFPAIPLPGTGALSAEQTKLVATTPGDAGLSSTLPLLPDTSAASKPPETPSLPQAEAKEQPVLEAFSVAREKALKLANEGKLKDALVLLTPQYRNPVITSSERSDLLDILDALAREVIFSTRPLIDAPYSAKATDTVETVATQHKITPELLANVNQLAGSKVLTQGQQIKVFEGPFRGEVDLTMGELTLFLKDMYACRFPISVGTDPVKTGAFEVADKQRDRTYYGAGKVIEASNPSNPYGGFWIDLGQGNCLHGSPEMAASDLTNAGCISLSPIDASDAYIMLTRGSQVVIRR